MQGPTLTCWKADKKEYNLRAETSDVGVQTSNPSFQPYTSLLFPHTHLLLSFILCGSIQTATPFWPFFFLLIKQFDMNGGGGGSMTFF